MDDNATWFFQKPAKEFHNSEQWWTAYFTMLILWNAAESAADSKVEILRFPLYGVTRDGNPCCLTENDRNHLEMDFYGARHENLVADAKLTGSLFDIAHWPNKFLNIRPDITFIKSSREKEVVFVEVKTIGASVCGNADLYEDLVAFLKDNGWQARLCYLVSAGHVPDSEWTVLEKITNTSSTKIILWEDVFKKAVNTPFEKLFSEPIQKYIKILQTIRSC